MIPNTCDEDILSIYRKCISIHQSKVQNNGDFLENDILVPLLDKNNIPYRKQVTIDDNGMIVGFNEKRRKCFHVIDFVIGKNIEVGRYIVDFKVISCKTSCRERWTQDDWTFSFIPQRYILLTISDDYPPVCRFRENSKRKIATCIPKKNDDRTFKLNFDNIIDELV